ncbi:MAG: hypothetical protein AAF462_11690 [Thermodesulfobacteriota bacterium]
MTNRNINLSIAIIATALFLTGCAAGQYGSQQAPPIPTTQAGPDGVIIAVSPSYWPWTPRNLGDYVTPYYVKVTNNSNKTIILDYKDIVLFDQFKTQYTPLSPDTVANIFNSGTGTTYSGGGYSYPRLSVGVGFGFGGGYGRRYGYRGYRRGYYGPRVGVYGYAPVYYYPPPATYYSRPVDTSDILTQALPLGPVHPGATVTGFLYFRDTIAQAAQVTLDIGYNTEGSTKENVLSFPFDLTLQRN